MAPPKQPPTPPYQQELLDFEVNPTKGCVSALRQTPTSKPLARVILGHGAGASMQHVHMQSLADSLANQNIETIRYQFPYMEAGGGRVDSLETCIDTIVGAIRLSYEFPPLPTFLAGHSFGARMSSHFVAETSSTLRGVIYFSFPLHPSKKPNTKRAEHLSSVGLPQLFVSGTRDSLADLNLLEPIVEELENAKLHLVDTADHGFKILKRTRVSSETVYEEAARVTKSFIIKHSKSVSK